MMEERDDLKEIVANIPDDNSSARGQVSGIRIQ